MNEFTKNMLKTSAILMIIAGGAAVLVGATNALTAPVIEKNNIEKEKKMLSEVYGKEADSYIEWSINTDASTNKVEHDNGSYLTSIKDKLSYVTKVWTAKKEGQDVGYIARFYGKNGYGSVDMLVGVSLDGKLGKLCIITDSMSYKTKLENSYITPYNDSNEKEKAVNDVKCGATFAAKIIQNGILEAQKVCMKEIASSPVAISLTMQYENKINEMDVHYTFTQERR